jgi:hypothetical protein
MGPLAYLCIALALAVPGTYGTMKVLEAKRVAAAYAEGKRAGASEVAAATTASANKTLAAVAEGEASAPEVPEAKAELVALCKRSASCRERGR